VPRRILPTLRARLLPPGSTGLDPARLIRVWALLRERRRELGQVLACSALSAVTLALVPLWVEALVGRVLLSQDMGRIFLHLLLGLLLFSLAQGAELGRDLYAARLTNRLGAETRRRLYLCLVQAPLAPLREWRTGDLIGRIGNDVEALAYGLRDGVLLLIPNLLLSVVLVGMMLVQSWWLLLLTLLLISPLALVSAQVLRRVRTRSREAQMRTAALNSAVDETVRGMQEIKAGGQQGRMGEWFGGLADDARRAYDRLELFRALNPAVVASQTYLTIGVLVMLCSWLVFQGHLTTGRLTLFVTSLLLVFTPLQRVSRALGQMSRVSAVLDRLDELERLPREAVADPKLPPLPPLRGELTLRGVSYRHGPDFALQDIDLRVHCGETVALVGPSGAGKSTLIRLLLGFLVPDRGEILVDGLPLHAHRLDSLRRQVGLVPQEPTMFDATLEENLRFACPDASPQALLEAARAARVDEFARELGQGYDTPLGQFGSRLSAGQRQRVAIARALLQDPRILIMDEPTSALDARTEALISETLGRHWADRTLLVVAHRPATLALADRILVMEGGRLRACGPQEAERIRSTAWRSGQEDTRST
jgi:ABC-type bacteriocin/lantibiotic exporter with double-glycine peptidase domain